MATQQGRWDNATRDDMRLTKSLHNKTTAHESDLRKKVERLTQERRTFLSRFNDQKARVFRRFNQIKADRRTARLRLRESVEQMLHQSPGGPGGRRDADQLQVASPTTAAASSATKAAWLNHSHTNSSDPEHLVYGVHTHDPGDRLSDRSQQEALQTRPFSSPAIRIHTAPRSSSSQEDLEEVFFIQGATTPPSSDTQENYLLVDGNFRSGGHPLSRSLNSLELTDRIHRGTYSNASSDDDLVFQEQHSSSSFFYTQNEVSNHGYHPRPASVAGTEWSSGRGAAMKKSRSCTLPQIDGDSGATLVISTNASPRSPSYLSSSMLALQLSPRHTRDPRPAVTPPSPRRLSPALSADSLRPTDANRSTVRPHHTDYVLNTSGPNLSPGHAGDGGFPPAGGVPTGSANDRGTGSGSTSSGDPAGGRLTDASQYQHGTQGVDYHSPGVRSKASVPTSINLCPGPGVPRNRSKGSTANSSANSSRDSSPGAAACGVEPASLERRISLAMARALSVDNRASVPSRKTPEQLDFYRRALSGSKLPVSPTDIRQRSSTYSSGDASSLKKKARAAAAKVSKAKADKLNHKKLKVSSTSTASAQEDIGNNDPTRLEPPTSTTTSAAKTSTGLQRGTEEQLRIPQQEAAVTEEVEVCDLGEDWQLQALPFRRRSVTFSGLSSKPVCRLPEIIERSPTPDKMAMLNLPVSVTPR